jgi:7-cyano-7-deazaguanine synthase in queuosine biosynthesis
MAVRNLSIKHNIPIDIVDLQGMGKLFYANVHPPYQLLTEGDMFDNDFSRRGSWKSITIMASYAASIGAKTLYHAATAEDMREFKEIAYHIEKAISLNSGIEDFAIELPYYELSHSQVLHILEKYDKEAITWSCLWGGEHHCGKCKGCQVRKNRYIKAGVTDKTIYEEIPAEVLKYVEQ